MAKRKSRGGRAANTGHAPAITEKKVQQTCERWLTHFGWRWTHTSDSRKTRGHRGVPDIMAVKEGRLLFVECKRSGGRFGKGQQEWMGELQIAGAVCLVVRPESLGTFIETLKAVSQPQPQKQSQNSD